MHNTIAFIRIFSVNYKKQKFLIINKAKNTLFSMVYFNTDPFKKINRVFIKINKFCVLTKYMKKVIHRCILKSHLQHCGKNCAYVDNVKILSFYINKFKQQKV